MISSPPSAPLAALSHHRWPAPTATYPSTGSFTGLRRLLSAFSACALTHDARWAVSASSDHTIRVWDLTTGRCLDTVYGTAPFESVAALGERICAGDRVGHVWMLVSVSGEAPSKAGP